MSVCQRGTALPYEWRQLSRYISKQRLQVERYCGLFCMVRKLSWKKLDAEWEMIAIQTNWKLNPASKHYPHGTATDASSQNDSEVETVTTVNHLHEHSITDAANTIQSKDARNELSNSRPISDHAAASTSTTSLSKMPLNTHSANNTTTPFLEVTTETVQS